MTVEAYQLRKVKVRDARAELGLTQRDLAERSGISQVTIYKVEQGETIRLLTAHALLQALNEKRKERKMIALRMTDLDWKVQGVEPPVENG